MFEESHIISRSASTVSVNDVEVIDIDFKMLSKMSKMTLCNFRNHIILGESLLSDRGISPDNETPFRQSSVPSVSLYEPAHKMDQITHILGHNPQPERPVESQIENWQVTEEPNRVRLVSYDSDKLCKKSDSHIKGAVEGQTSTEANFICNVIESDCRTPPLSPLSQTYQVHRSYTPNAPKNRDARPSFWNETRPLRASSASAFAPPCASRVGRQENLFSVDMNSSSRYVLHKSFLKESSNWRQQRAKRDRLRTYRRCNIEEPLVEISMPPVLPDLAKIHNRKSRHPRGERGSFLRMRLKCFAPLTVNCRINTDAHATNLE